MDQTTANYLIDQLRTGLIQPEELTGPEIVEVLAMEKPAMPREVVARLKQVERVRFLSSHTGQ